MSVCIVLVLLSCVKPVDLEAFLNSLTKPDNSDFGVDIGYDVSDESPRLQWSSDGGVSWTILNEGGTVTISLDTSPGMVIIQVIDDSDYADIFWYCDSAAALTAGQGVTGANSEKFTVTAGELPFTAAKTYQMAVVGKKSGQQYGTSVFIKVIS